jgi:hypothetical protein
MLVRHRERHRTEHVGWLRAAVLGANDGILSTASLVLGVAAAHGTRSSVLVAGVAGLVAGAMAMAAGEFVSVHSQADTEKADLARERVELSADACPRRTRHLRSSQSASGSGCVHVGRQLCYWSSSAPHRFCLSPGDDPDYVRVRNFADLPRASGCVGRARGWRKGHAERNARHLLGCAGHGNNRRRRGFVRNCRVASHPVAGTRNFTESCRKGGMRMNQ